MSKATNLVYIISNLALMVVAGVLLLVIYLVMKPFARGFYCNDQSIMYPYKDDTVSILAAVVVGGILVVLPIPVLELIRHLTRRKNSAWPYSQEEKFASETLPCCSNNIALTVSAICKYIFLAIFGGICTLYFTEIVKRLIGRHRPHFLSVCRPNTAHPLYNCSTYIPNTVCEPDDQKKFNEAQLSFPSGHASFSLYAVVFACVYIQARLSVFSSHVFKNIIQLAFMLWGIYVCCTRVSDYKHHWSDVLGGGLLGTVVALITGLKIAPSFLNCGFSCESRHDEEFRATVDPETPINSPVENDYNHQLN